MAVSIAPPPQKPDNDWRLFLKLLPYARRNPTLLKIVGVLLIPSAIGNVMQPFLLGQVVAVIREDQSRWPFLQDLSKTSGLQTLIAILLGVLCIRFVLETVQNYLVQTFGQRTTAEIRQDLFTHVTSLAIRFFERTPVGKLITRLTSDVDALGEAFSTGAVGILNDLVSIVVMIIFLANAQARLTALLLAFLLPMAFSTIYFQKRYRVANYKVREELSSLNSMLQENINGIGVVQLFRRETINSQMFRESNLSYIKKVDDTIFYDSIISASLEWISFVAQAGVILVSSYLLGIEQSGTIATFIFASPRLFEPLRQFAEKFTAIQAGFTAIERVSELMNEPIEIRDRVGHFTTAQDATVMGEIRFENVWFGYKPDEFVLQDLDFTIRPGEKVALVGPTGAGKSSIIRLLSRLYDPTRGRIFIDGTDIRDLPQAELRRHVGIILQDGFIFAGDVKSNITLGEDYEFDTVKAAAVKTNVDRLIEQLPQGYDTQLRERGTNLSAGQKQLLAFARSAIREPQILVLDEATSSLDVGTEAMIQEALERMLENRTAIIIAHRLSTIRHVDRILVLKRGHLVESGSHEELLKLDGLYSSLYKLQMLGTES